ncbi:MAG: acid phosphatase [Pseudomonadota bacterium]|nr:acid phosphatase [Pseudomonadota bacterium]
MKRVLLALALTGFCAVARADEAKPGLDRINHIVVIYLENRSFDNLYGLFPGAEGVPADVPPQLDKDGKPYDTLPPVNYVGLRELKVDERFPRDLPNKPFRADKYVGLEGVTGDAWHRFYQEQLQIDGGKMDKFVAWSDAASLVMGYNDASRTPMWRLAKDYTLMDHFHHGAFGGSFFNHIYMICLCAAKFPDAPDDIKARLDENGGLIKDGAVTPDGFAVNTLFPRGGPLPAWAKPDRLVPPQTAPTIGDRLDDKGIDWAWYSGGWDNAVANRADPLFQFHHQPFAYFAHYALGSPGAKHLKDEHDFIADITHGALPPVAFFKPVGEDNEHPGYSAVLAGENHTAFLIEMIQKSPLWKDTAIIVTYDENGGLWDHVAPPKGDRWGPGSRVPALLISPFAKRGFIDHTVMDTTAIDKLIETRFGLAPLGARDAASPDMTQAFDFGP